MERSGEYQIAHGNGARKVEIHRIQRVVKTGFDGELFPTFCIG